MLKIKKNILIHFRAKNILKSNHHHTFKHSLKDTKETNPRRYHLCFSVLVSVLFFKFVFRKKKI